jgi:hypothetical protein
MIGARNAQPLDDFSTERVSHTLRNVKAKTVGAVSRKVKKYFREAVKCVEAKSLFEV